MIPQPPETRPSLILRLRDSRDAEAWQEFAAIYQPLVYRLARMKGLQDADAQELEQDVMVAVSRAVEDWVPDAERGKFRHWLFQIAENLIVNYLTRKRFRPLGTGDSRVAAMLDQQCDPACEESAVFDLEFRREVFRWAAAQVQSDAFRNWASHVESCPDCQDRLTQLAADDPMWAEASQFLHETPGDLGSTGSSWSGTQTPPAVERQLDCLSPASHPEMLGRLGRYDIERVIGMQYGAPAMGPSYKQHSVTYPVRDQYMPGSTLAPEKEPSK